MKQQISELDVNKIHPNRRIHCARESIESLCRSIRSGVPVDPIAIRFTGERFIITDGEERWRACKKLGIKRVKVLIIEE